MTQTIEHLTARVRELESEVAHWKNNHETEVRRARTLKERTDMPIERVQAYEKWGEDQARVRELEEENARLKEIEQTNDTLLDQLGDKNAALLDEVASQKHCYVEAVAHYEKQLAASQLREKQLREALCECASKLESQVSRNPLPPYYREIVTKSFRALALPRDTSALDAYVAESVKEARPDFRQMREMLRAMQAGELTVSRGIEILNMWHAGNWNDNMLPPVRQDLIEEDSMPVEIIDRCNQQIATLTRQRDFAVEALEWIASSLPQIGVERVWMLDHAIKTLLAAIKESEGK